MTNLPDPVPPNRDDQAANLTGAVVSPDANRQRVSWADAALDRYAGIHPGTGKDGDDIVDLLTDLGHWCDAHDVDYRAAVFTAAGNRTSERDRDD